MVARRLSARQLRVIDDLIADKTDERQILTKHKVKAQEFAKWLADDMFMRQFRERVHFARLRREAISERALIVAMKKLIERADSDETEDSRPACIDIMNSVGVVMKMVTPSEKKEERPSGAPVFPAATMRKVRGILAEASRKERRTERAKAKAEGTDITQNANG